MAITKPAGTWTYEDLFSLPDDGRRYEIIEGQLHEMPAPNLVHATVVMNLITLLLPIVSSPNGRLFTAPLDVFFQGADPVQPDIIVILPGWSWEPATARPRRRARSPDRSPQPCQSRP